MRQSATVVLPMKDVPAGEGARAEIRRAADDYRDRLAWPVRVIGTSLVLPLANGLAAVTVPPSMAHRTLRNVERFGGSGPVTVEPGDPGRVIFLVDANDLVVPQAELPPGVRFLCAPRVVALPPTDLLSGPVDWVRAPSARNRWLPSAAAVLAALPR